MHRQQQQQSRLQTSNSVTFSPSTLGSQDDTRQAKPSSHQLGFAGSSRQHVAPAQGYSTKQGDYSAGQRQMYGGSKYEVQRSSPSAPQLGKPSVLKQSGGQRWHTGSGRGSVLDTNSPDDEQVPMHLDVVLHCINIAGFRPIWLAKEEITNDIDWGPGDFV